MPFKKVNVSDEIQRKLKSNVEFKKVYSEIDAEYELIREVISMRKEAGISQSKIAKESGLKQQFVSRIETVGSSPTLRNFLKYIDGAGLKIKIEKKSNDENDQRCITI